MDSESNSHQQTALTEYFTKFSDDESSDVSVSNTELRALFDDYLTAKRTSGSQA